MELAETIAVGLVTVFWIGVDLYLLFDPLVAEGLSSQLGVSPIVLEFGVLVLGLVLTGVVHWAADQSDC